MIWKSYYIQSNGQPANNVVEHDDPAVAIDAWVANIGALYDRWGGRSVLIECDEPVVVEEDENGQPVQVTDEEYGADLVWVEHTEGPYAYGELADRAGVKLLYEDLEEEEHLTPEAVANRMRSMYRVTNHAEA